MIPLLNQSAISDIGTFLPSNNLIIVFPLIHFPETLSSYDLVIHCGACMLNEREIQYRLACAIDEGVPMTNYGIAIAHMNGILERTTAVFKKI